MSEEKYDSIVFYDGDCGFCNSTVQLILKKRKREFHFSALQSNFAKKELSQYGILIQIDTIYFTRNGKCFERSSAALQIAKGMKGLYPLLVGFYIIPRFIRDWVYNGIAKRRHRIAKGYCAIPKEEEKKFFIKD